MVLREAPALQLSSSSAPSAPPARLELELELEASKSVGHGEGDTAHTAQSCCCMRFLSHAEECPIIDDDTWTLRMGHSLESRFGPVLPVLSAE